jgi:hypothetical protein
MHRAKNAENVVVFVTEIGSCKWSQLTKGLGPCGDACFSGRISMIHAGSAGRMRELGSVQGLIQGVIDIMDRI